ncbi:hypothetical protein GOL25_31545 [Sinorhizobium medicae]|nr:hypothetical protein [Sinorhizobium medicae]
MRTQDAQLRGQELVIIFQEPMTSPSPIHTIGDQITEMIHLHGQLSHEEARRRAADMQIRVGLPRSESRTRKGFNDIHILQGVW